MGDAPCSTTRRLSSSISSYPVARFSSLPSFANVRATVVVKSSPRSRIPLSVLWLHSRSCACTLSSCASWAGVAPVPVSEPVLELEPSSGAREDVGCGSCGDESGPSSACSLGGIEIGGEFSCLLSGDGTGVEK